MKWIFQFSSLLRRANYSALNVPSNKRKIMHTATLGGVAVATSTATCVALFAFKSSSGKLHSSISDNANDEIVESTFFRRRFSSAFVNVAACESVEQSENQNEEDNVGKQNAGFDDQWPEAARELRAKFEHSTTAAAAQAITDDDGVLRSHGVEMSGHAAPAWPHIVIYPESTEDVQFVMRVCHRHNVPVVPYAAGTSLEGHTVATRGGVCIDLSRMKRVLAVRADDADCTVQPGIGWIELNEVLGEHGFFLGVDPAPGAQIGGMCATCCSGTNAVRYGTMRNQVLNLTVVLADGSVVRTGQRARKSSAGYALEQLFVGSEGTLGIVTEATLRMRRVPPRTSLATINFDSVSAAARAVIEILHSSVNLGAVELFDEKMVRAVNDYNNLQLKETPFILFKFSGNDAQVTNDIAIVQEIVQKHSTHEYNWFDGDEADRLWSARKTAFWAAQSYGNLRLDFSRDADATCAAASDAPRVARGRRVLMATDVAVPISRLAECIEETKKDLNESFLFAPIVGHVGDGNFHVAIIYNRQDEKESKEAHKLHARMIRRAIAMEGTCTGEHGVGIGKKEFLIEEKGEDTIEIMRKLKKALDSTNILNPDKIFDFEKEIK